jgi:capsular exopolysaccharide synthesis family protein
MRYILLSILFIQILFAQELTRKIMVSSFNTLDDANYALNIFNEERSDKFIKLQKEMNFNVIARPSDDLFVIAIEAFTDYTQAKIILNQISTEHPDAYINKYKDTQKIRLEALFDDMQYRKTAQVENTNDINNIEIKRVKPFEDFEKEKKVNENNQNQGLENRIEENQFYKSSIGKQYSMILHTEISILNKIKSNLSVYPLIKDSSIIRVEYKDYTAQKSSNFVNQLLKEYLEQNKNENSKQLKESLNFIEIQMNKSKDDLSKAERELESFRSENLLFNTDKKVEQINKQKTDLQKEFLSLERKAKIFESMKESLLKGEMVSSSSFDDPSLTDTLKQLNKERSLQQELSAKYTPSHKTMIALKEKVITLEDNIIKNVKNTDRSLKEGKKSLKSQIKELNDEILIIPKQAMELSKLERRFKLKESIYKDLLLKYNDISSKYISSQRVNRIIDYAIEPQFPVKPKKSMIFIIGFMLALLIAFIVVLIKEYFDVYIKRPSDLTSLSKTPYYGYIPFIKSKNYNKLFILDDLTSDESEALRRIRSSLDLTVKKDDARVILTTSTISNEGKSTFIANLAVMLALSGKKTILLGLDLRIPQLHTKFNLKNEKGMSDLLANNVSLEEVIQSVRIKDKSDENIIDVVTSGSNPPNPSELIENGSIDEILKELRTKYDYILIDSTPTALVPDSLTLLNKADTTLFIFKSEYSKKEFVEYTDELINKYDLKSAGYVLTSVKKKYYEQIKYDKNYSLFASKN